MSFRTDGAYGFYPIVETAAQVAWLVELGVRTMQLRNKSLSGGALKFEVRAAVDAAATVDAQLVINDHWQAAIDAGAPFVHLGQSDLAGADLAAIAAADIGLGISSHSPGERLRAVDCDPAYVALGPVYKTTLKKMPWAPQGLGRVSQWKAALPCPLVGIGGITLERAPGVLDAGADSLAVVSDLLRPDADDRVRAWLHLFESRSTLEAL